MLSADLGLLLQLLNAGILAAIFRRMGTVAERTEANRRMIDRLRGRIKAVRSRLHDDAGRGN